MIHDFCYICIVNPNREKTQLEKLLAGCGAANAAPSSSSPKANGQPQQQTVKFEMKVENGIGNEFNVKNVEEENAAGTGDPDTENSQDYSNSNSNDHRLEGIKEKFDRLIAEGDDDEFEDEDGEMSQEDMESMQELMISFNDNENEEDMNLYGEDEDDANNMQQIVTISKNSKQFESFSNSNGNGSRLKVIAPQGLLKEEVDKKGIIRGSGNSGWGLDSKVAFNKLQARGNNGTGTTSAVTISPPNFSLTRHLLEGEGSSTGFRNIMAAANTQQQRISYQQRMNALNQGNMNRLKTAAAYRAGNNGTASQSYKTSSSGSNYNMNDLGPGPYSCHLCGKIYQHHRLDFVFLSDDVTKL